MDRLVLSIIIPAYNEEHLITAVLDNVQNSLKSNGIDAEIVVIDDSSTDATVKNVEEFIKRHPERNIRLIASTPNRGKGFAIRQGIAAAKGDFVLIQDADHEYDPRDYPRLLAPLLEDKADVVYGSRFVGGNPHRILFFWHSIGNKFLTFVSNAFTNLNLTDMETGYKVFRTAMIQQLKLRENRFGIEPEMTAKISRIPGVRIYEVGISYYGRTYDEGKKINWKDGVCALYCILHYGAHRSPLPMQFLIYVFIGGIAAVFNLLLFLLLMPKLSVGFSAIIAFYAAAAVNYWLCTHLLFKKNVRWKSWTEQAVYYAAVTGIAFVDVTLTKGLMAIGLAAASSKLAASGIGLILNFLARRYLVFPEKRVRM